MSKIDGQAIAPKAPAGGGNGGPEATPAPEKLALGGDSFKGGAVPMMTEEDRQKAAVEAAKAAAAGSGTPGADPPGRLSAWGVVVEIGARPLQGRDIVFQRVANAVVGARPTPLEAMVRSGVRLIPLAGIVPLLRDIVDARDTAARPTLPRGAKALDMRNIETGEIARDPRASDGEKALSAVRAFASVATTGAMALLLVTAAPAFLPWGLAAGAIALTADVALSRMRTGHW
jgi:hypothetical protein